MPDVDVVVPNDFCCPITSEVMIEPVKTDCKQPNGTVTPHIFEKLALTKWLRTNTSCPACRFAVTEVVPDADLASRIQNEFVRVNTENRDHFDEVGRALNTADVYDSVRGEPVMPRVARRPSTEMSFDELLESLGIPHFARFPFSAPRARPATDLERYSQVISNIRANNLPQAETDADRINSASLWKNTSYEKIVDAHVSKANSNITHLDDATRVTSKISSVQTKNKLFGNITFAFIKHAKFSKAFNTIRKVSNPLIQFILCLFVVGGAALFGVIFVFTKVFETLRKLADNVRARIRRLRTR